MTLQADRTLAAVIRDMIMERQRLLIREANYLRGLVGLPPVRAEKERGEEVPTRHATSREPGSGRGITP